jgi:hypothetical protein
MTREVSLSSFAMLLAIFLPNILLWLIWKQHLADLPMIFLIANDTHRYYELLAALIPLMILVTTVGWVFLSEFDRTNSALRPQFRLCFLIPVLSLNVFSIIFFGSAINFKDDVLPSSELWLLSIAFAWNVVMLLVADGFMAAARTEIKYRKPPPRRRRHRNHTPQATSAPNADS